MFLRYLYYAVVLIGLSPLHAESWAGHSSIEFKGTSTLHDWEGKVTAEPFEADVTFSEGKPQHVKSLVTVKAAGMDTAEAKRDENMRKAMNVKTHPLITAKIDADFSQIASKGKPTSLPMELTLLNRVQNITAKISNWQLQGDKASFDLEFPVSMKASGISVPSVLLFIRVGDVVTVRAHVTLRKP